MKSPRQIAADLRSLASKIERSNRPSKVAVSHAIKRVLVAMSNSTLSAAINNAVQQISSRTDNNGDIPIGDGVTLFPNHPDLDESSYTISWTEDNPDVIFLTASHKRDVDVLLEFTFQEATTETDKIVAMIEKAMEKDANTFNLSADDGDLY